MTPSGRLRVAVIGVGHLGRHHVRLLAGMPRVELVAAADLIAERAHARSIAAAGLPRKLAALALSPQNPAGKR